MKHIITCLAFCIFIICDSFSQEIDWQNTLGGNLQDEFEFISPTTDGGSICGGFSNSTISGDKTENVIGGTDYWIVKLDFAGNIQWQQTIGGLDVEFLADISQTTDGGYICGGTSQSDISGDKTENCLGGPDYWIVKLDSTGNIQWQNTIGSAGNDWLFSIQQTIDGGYICGGISDANISGDKTENTLGGDDYWVVKLDSTGNIQWQNTIGGSADDWLYSVRQSNDGGFICGGWSMSGISGDKTENSKGGEDYWVVKLDNNGNILWQNTIGGSNYDALFSISSTADGGCICGGYSESNISADKTENSFGAYDYWIIKLDSTGNIQWQKTIGGSAVDALESISQTNDLGFICCGYSASGISGNKTENCTGANDYWIIKLDSLGNIEWQNTIGGNLADDPFVISQTSDGNFICGGWSASGTSGDKAENCIGSTDYWIVKITGKYNLITGKTFIDLNSNAVQDSGEPSLPQSKITEQSTGRFSYSQPTGFFNLSVLDSGNFSVVALPVNYYNAIPVSHPAIFSGIQQTDSLNDFAFQPSGTFDDLCITLTPVGNFRSGFDAEYIINYENVGTTILNPTIIFFPDSNLTFVSSSPPASNIYSDSISWALPAIGPYQSGSISVTVNLNAGIPVGTFITSRVRIDPILNDANILCNYSIYEIQTTGSFDPNAILVDEDTLTAGQISIGSFLDYTIYFQNTGNDTAFTVKIINPIDTSKLDLSSFEWVASSNPVNLNWINYQHNMEFKLENILLPDSNINEPASHGFVRYRIRPKTNLVAGNSISNVAYIYFDYNVPVQTNTALTTIISSTGIEQNNSENSGLKVFPNPVQEQLTVNCEKLIGENGLLKVYNVFGQTIFEKHLKAVSKQLQTTLDVSKFSKGIYIMELDEATTVLRSKFIKQ